MSYLVLGLLAIIAIAQGTIYMPPIKDDNLMTEMLLRDLIDRMGNELAEAADTYFEYQDNSRLANDYARVKEIPSEMPNDYDANIEAPNPNPSARDQEYLRHGTLAGHRQRPIEIVKGGQRIQLTDPKGMNSEKTENSLPAYCTPPNPCPIGYTSENRCIENFENTAAFSRDFQSAQDCMCDAEHMADCARSEEIDRTLSGGGARLIKSDFDRIVEQFQNANPYFRGEKLPIAAKKGIHVVS